MTCLQQIDYVYDLNYYDGSESSRITTASCTPEHRSRLWRTVETFYKPLFWVRENGLSLRKPVLRIIGSVLRNGILLRIKRRLGQWMICFVKTKTEFLLTTASNSPEYRSRFWRTLETFYKPLSKVRKNGLCLRKPALGIIGSEWETWFLLRI